MSMVRASVVQAAPVPFDTEGTLERVREITADAARDKAQLVLFPEAFVSAYPRGLNFHTYIGKRKFEGREEFRRYFDSAIEVPGPAVDSLGATARENGVHLVIGVIERDGGTLYCTVLFFAPDGTYMGKHRKLMPTSMERMMWGFGDGSTMPVFDTPLGKLGTVICWENYMPLLRTTMYAKRIQIYCAPTADESEEWTASMRHIGREGRCFVLSCNQFLRRGDFPDDYAAAQGDDPETILCRGGSCIVGPLGELLAGPDFEKECILTADLDMDEIARGKFDMDVTGHYARPDVFRLFVNERPAPAVVTRSASVDDDVDPFSSAAS